MCVINLCLEEETDAAVLSHYVKDRTHTHTHTVSSPVDAVGMATCWMTIFGFKNVSQFGNLESVHNRRINVRKGWKEGTLDERHA